MNTDFIYIRTVIYDRADFDGIFCREIARKFLGNDNVEYLGWDFKDAPLAIPPEGTIYILDLPVDRVFGFEFGTQPKQFVSVLEIVGDAPKMKALNERLIWIDHHKSSIETHPKEIPGYRIDGVSACRLAWQWFTATIDQLAEMALPEKQTYVLREVTEPLAVRLAGEYDIWDKRDERAELFQHGLRSQELDSECWVKLLDGSATGDILVQALLAQGEAIHTEF